MGQPPSFKLSLPSTTVKWMPMVDYHIRSHHSFGRVARGWKRIPRDSRTVASVLNSLTGGSPEKSQRHSHAKLFAADRADKNSWDVQIHTVLTCWLCGMLASSVTWLKSSSLYLLEDDQLINTLPFLGSFKLIGGEHHKQKIVGWELSLKDSFCRGDKMDRLLGLVLGHWSDLS